MSILNRYIAKEYLIFFATCFFSLTAIGITFSSLSELKLLNEKGGKDLFIAAILSALPLLIEIILPIAVLLSTILTFANFSKTSEAVAMQASGLSLYQLIRPLFLLGIFIALFSYFNQSYLAPLWGADKKLLLVQKQEQNFAWRHYQGKLYYFGDLAPRYHRASWGRVFEFNNSYKIKRLEILDDLYKKDQSITLKVKNIYNFYPSRFEVTEGEEKKLWEKEYPVIFRDDVSHPKYLSFWSLFQEVRIKMASGESPEKTIFAFYQKLASLLGVFVMILLALPFSLFSGRAANVRMGIVLAIILGFVFWLIEQIGAGLFDAKILGAFPAAFTGDFIFIVLALVLIKRKVS